MPNTREKLIELIETTVPREKVAAYGEVPVTVGQIADHLIANGITVKKWIPVTERLPEVVDCYLVVVKAKYDHEDEYEIGVDVATYNPYEGGYIDDCWNTYNDWDEGQQDIHVTHWMPLPEPPKGE